MSCYFLKAETCCKWNASKNVANRKPVAAKFFSQFIIQIYEHGKFGSQSPSFVIFHFGNECKPICIIQFTVILIKNVHFPCVLQSISIFGSSLRGRLRTLWNCRSNYWICRSWEKRDFLFASQRKPQHMLPANYELCCS